MLHQHSLGLAEGRSLHHARKSIIRTQQNSQPTRFIVLQKFQYLNKARMCAGAIPGGLCTSLRRMSDGYCSDAACSPAAGPNLYQDS